MGKGRQLKQFGNYSYKHNNDGIRIEKVENCKTHKYILDGTNILKEIVEETCCNCTGYTNEYLYDLDGTVCGLKYNGTAYYFYKNLQGDVIAITDETGAVVARYSYDAWGKCKVESDTSGVGIANINPFRYRSYYYDAEIGMYYLQSRYYDPEVGRFINADEILYLGREKLPTFYNTFTYCENSPVLHVDSRGFASKKIYNGIVGFGIQIALNINLLCYQGVFGIEAIWFAFTGNKNFGNGLMPWCYCFGGISMGLNFNISAMLSKNFLSSPKQFLKGVGLGFSCSIGVTFFLIRAYNMESPADYLRDFQFSSITVWGITASRATGGKINTYGVGFTWEIGASAKKGISIGKLLFGVNVGWSYYKSIPVGKNAKELYNTVKNKV